MPTNLDRNEKEYSIVLDLQFAESLLVLFLEDPFPNRIENVVVNLARKILHYVIHSGLQYIIHGDLKFTNRVSRRSLT